MEQWPEIVGAPLAERTRPLRLAGHRLFVLCHGAALRQELTFHKREILKKFNRAAGQSGTARELVLLESDSQLSSLIKDTQGEEWRQRVAEDARARAQLPEETPEAEDASRDARIAAAYPRFQGDAYRQEMQRIDHESRGHRQRPVNTPATGRECGRGD